MLNPGDELHRKSAISNKRNKKKSNAVCFKEFMDEAGQKMAAKRRDSDSEQSLNNSDNDNNASHLEDDTEKVLATTSSCKLSKRSKEGSHAGKQY